MDNKTQNPQNQAPLPQYYQQQVNVIVPKQRGCLKTTLCIIAALFIFFVVIPVACTVITTGVAMHTADKEAAAESADGEGSQEAESADKTGSENEQELSANPQNP